MIEYPIVEEVRRIRNEYAKQFNYDLDAVCRDLRQKQERSGRKTVSFPPKKNKDGIQQHQPGLGAFAIGSNVFCNNLL